MTIKDFKKIDVGIGWVFLTSIIGIVIVPHSWGLLLPLLIVGVVSGIAYLIKAINECDG